jgi:trigger factor
MPVKTNVTELPESRVRVQAEVPADEVERRVNQTARELGRTMRIPGFRKGKVPPPVVIGRLGRDAVLDEALRNALGSWYADAIDDASIATLETVERPAEAGDHVVIDYQGTIDGEPFPGGEGRDRLIELGTGRLLPGFDEQLTGASAGEQRTVEVTFPEGELEGKQAMFEVTVNEVKAKHLPDLDDEFAAEAAGFDTLAELREDIATKLREADTAAVEREFEQAVLDAAVAEARIEVPEKLIHARAHELLEQTLHALSHQGISKEAYLRVAGKDEESLAKDAEPEAESILKREAVLAAVVEAEQIEPTDAELLEAIRPTAEREGEEAEKVLQRLRDRGRLGPLIETVSERQALELLVSEAEAITVEQAKARDKLWTPEKEGESSGQLWTPGS